MIKFFRKIRQNLLMENKTGKYLKYAFGEIVLVVIGILIALSINNWNQQRISDNKEQILLTELYQEFVDNKVQFETVINVHQKALERCDSLIARFPFVMEPEDLKNRQKVWSYIYGLKTTWTFNPSQGIINSLVSTSSFELISNRELRKLLVSWNDILVDYQEGEIGSKKFVDDFLNPYLNDHFQVGQDYADPRLDASVLASTKFENIVHNRKEHLLNILGRENDMESSKIRTAIDRIIELSNPENQ
ncbi:MAG: hypothetical protein DA407_05810 [Bacteroidetes bacterium]|nr:MAG: hypothetical protein DA407_05810 [Bacteroidota bacterium]